MKNSPTTPVHATNAFSSAGSDSMKAFDTPTAEGSSEKSELRSLEAEMSLGRYWRSKVGTSSEICKHVFSPASSGIRRQ